MADLERLERIVFLEHSGRDDTIYNVAWGTCEEDEAVIERTWRALHNRLIAANPVRYGRVQGGWYRPDATPAELRELGAPPEVLLWMAKNPGTVLVVAMVEIPPRG